MGDFLKKTWDISLFITVIMIIIAYAVQEFSVEDKNQKLEKQQKEINRLSKLIQENNRVPEAGTFDIQGIPKHVATRYYMVYVQLVLLAESANAPENHLRWLRNIVRQGILHNVLEEYELIALDKSSKEPKVAAKLSVSIDWEQSRVYSKLKAEKGQELDNIYSQPIMTIAKSFSTIVEREDLDVEMRCRTVAEPNLKALNALGVPEYYNPHKKQVNLSYEKFENLVHEKLNLINTTTPRWRDGDEITFESVSELTPELKIKLKYISREKNELYAE